MTQRASLLALDQARIDRCRDLASRVADEIDTLAREHTTVAVERTVCRLFGVDGATDDGTPFPNLLVEATQTAGRLPEGVTRPLIEAMCHLDASPQEATQAVAERSIDLKSLPTVDDAVLLARAEALGAEAFERIDRSRQTRDHLQERTPASAGPLLYVIVATGNIYEDAVQARTAARQGADVIAVIRSTGQSLIDYVPYGPTTEGFGGTYATQANFRIIREALDEVGEELGRYILLCNYCSGLCMPEIAAMGAMERLDMMLNDALYGILFRDINPRRTLIDQRFSRMINAAAGVIINTGEDNYLTTDDAEDATHTVLASNFINEQLALRAGLQPEQIGLGHALEMNPDTEDGFLMELAQAQLVREAFPGYRLKYMPPTRYMTGNIFRGIVQDALFVLAGGWTQQSILLLGMHTEAMHTPHIADRKIALENATLLLRNTRSLHAEIQFRPGGFVQERAHATLRDTQALLETIADEGLLTALEEGRFAAVRRDRDGGRGLHGVIRRAANYLNPLENKLETALGLHTGGRP